MSEKSAPDEYRAILLGEARSVDVIAIESELTQLWKAAAEDTLEGQPVVRACVVNLVVYAPSDEAAEHINETISHVSARHPNRSIVIVADADAKPIRLSASISAHCQIPPAGSKQVCSEQITLRASGAAVDEVHGTVLPLLIPDLPVFLWWHDEPPLEDHLFWELLGSSEYLVVDSADLPPERAGDALERLQKLVQEGDVVLSDLNWSRLAHWRELVAQFFDAPPARGYLERLDRVSVEIASNRGGVPDFTEGLLLVGWLASRLGWTWKDGADQPGEGVVAFDLMSGTGKVSVEVKEAPAGISEGLQSLKLAAGGDATCSVSREADEEGCVVVAGDLPEGGGGHPRVVRMDTLSEAALLGDELDTLGRDAAFEEALAQAVRFTAGGLR